VPPVASVPPPTSVFSDSEQVAIYVPQLANVTEFTLRVFRDPSGEFVGQVGSQAPAEPPVEWFDTLVWYHEGPEAVGEYRVELYSGGTLTNVMNFAVRQQVAQVPTAAPAATAAPGVTAAPAPPPGAPPPAPPGPPPATATPRPPAPAPLGDGQWRALGTVESNDQNAGLVYFVATAPQAPNTLLAAGDNGIYRSLDGGQTWRRSDSPPNTPAMRWIAYSPRTGVVYVAGEPKEASASARQGIYRSTDGGATFDEYALIGRPVQRVDFTPDGSAMFASVAPGGRREPGTLYRSTDEGASWAPVLNLGDVNLVLTAVQFSPNYGSDRTIYASAGAVPVAVPTPGPGQAGTGTQPSTYGTVFRSTDDGRTWLVRDKQPSGAPLASVWTLAAGPGGGGYNLYAGTDRGMAVSSNGGDTWTRAADAGGFAANKYVVDVVEPQANGLVGALCPEDRAQKSPDKGGIEWKDCPTATWTSGSGRWTAISGDLGNASAVFGKINVTRSAGGPPAIYLGTDGGKVYLYSIAP
jgi:photosystem II stability/assembly factor-like uncharacterized protein